MRLLQPDLDDYQRNTAQNFASWLLDVGDGNIGEVDEENPNEAAWIKIPAEFQIPDDENGVQTLINFIYDNQTLQQPTAEVLQQKAIVCPKNETADEINTKILS